MTPGGVLGELVVLADSVRGHAVDWFGPWAPVVTLIVQSLAAIAAVLLAAMGRSLWAPPFPELKNFPVRMAGLLSMVGMVALYVASKARDHPISFLLIATLCTIVLAVAGLLYMIVYPLLTFKCPGDGKTIHVRGLRLVRDARRVLDNDKGPPPLPAIRTIIGGVRPVDEVDYFCKANRDMPSFIWTRRSLVAAKTILVLTYWPLAISLLLLLVSGAYAIKQADTQVAIQPSAVEAKVPNEQLFSFDDAHLKPGAATTLQPIAALIRTKWKGGSIVIRGHSDKAGENRARGTAHNDALSKARAESVKAWLIAYGNLPPDIPFDVRGLGARDPAMNDENSDGTDNPDGRRLNRRVTIEIPLNH